LKDVKSFKRLLNCKYNIGTSSIIYNDDTVYPLDEDIYVLTLFVLNFRIL